MTDDELDADCGCGAELEGALSAGKHTVRAHHPKPLPPVPFLDDLGAYPTFDSRPGTDEISCQLGNNARAFLRVSGTSFLGEHEFEVRVRREGREGELRISLPVALIKAAFQRAGL